MTLSSIKQVKKTTGKLLDDFILNLSKSRDWTQIRRGQKIDVEIKDPQFLQLFKIYGKRTNDMIDASITVAIEKFYSIRIAEGMVSTNSDELKEKLENIARNAEESRKTLVSQQETKNSLSGKLDWVSKYFSGILGEVRIFPSVIMPISLSQVNADLVNKLVCFDCNIDGVETQQAIDDKYNTLKSDIVNAESYNADQHGRITEIFYTDFQYYWLREPIKEFSKKKSLRKIAGQSYGKFVGKYETSDKVRILGYYRTIPKGLKSTSPADDVEIQIVNMERLENDVEITLSKEEIAEFEKYANESPVEFIRDFTQSCAPHIQGNDVPKLGIILAEIGPSTLVQKYRPHIHLYLTGNPGTAKSEMLKWFAQISFMGVYADAPNASSRGLMYGQEEYGKRKILKAGLMVRNEKLYLDELDKMGETRQELNTAMEQQIASYHKNPFDIDTAINCTVIAAGNPQFGKWKDGIDLLDQLKPIKPELLSRFLVIRVLATGETRSRLAHILNTMHDRENTQPKFIKHQIAGWINHCRKLNPPMSANAEKSILDFAEKFQEIKQESESNLDFEVRAQINVIRISTALAKFLHKKIIDESCVSIAINFINQCNESIGMNTTIPTIQTDLGGKPTDPKVAFLRIVKQLQQSSPDGCFSESELIQEMLKLDQFWRTEDSATGFWNRYNPRNHKDSDFFEPHTGRFRKV